MDQANSQKESSPVKRQPSKKSVPESPKMKEEASKSFSQTRKSTHRSQKNQDLPVSRGKSQGDKPIATEADAKNSEDSNLVRSLSKGDIQISSKAQAHNRRKTLRLQREQEEKALRQAAEYQN